MKEIVTSLRRTPYQSLAMFFSLFLTLFLSLLLMFSLTFLYGLLSYVEARPQVTIYFQNETSESAILEVRKELEQSGKVTSVKYVSKNEAYALYRDLNKDNPLLLEMVSAEILPASLEIFASRPAYLPELAAYLEKVPGKDEVNYQKNVVEKLLALTSVVRTGSLVFFGFLMFTTTIILITITHFKVALRKEEIELQRLMGASASYVRRPFMREALFLGFISSSLVFSLFSLIVYGAYPYIQSYLRGVQSLFVELFHFKLIVWPFSVEYVGVLFGLLTLFGILIAGLATLFATKKYIAIQRS